MRADEVAQPPSAGSGQGEDPALEPDVALAARRILRQQLYDSGYSTEWSDRRDAHPEATRRARPPEPPLQFHPEFGPVAIDLEGAWWSDGRRFRVDDADACRDGRHERTRSLRVRHDRAPAEARPQPRDGRAIRRLQVALRRRGDASAPACVCFFLLDDSRLRFPVPSRLQCLAAVDTDQRAGRAREFRREQRLCRRQVRSQLLAAFQQHAERVGAAIASAYLSGRPRVRVVGTPSQLAELLDAECVQGATLDSPPGRAGHDDGEPGLGYLCAQTPGRYRPALDDVTCKQTTAVAPPFMDSLHAATGAFQYFHAGYDGATTGLAGWAYYQDDVFGGPENHLTLGMVDNDLLPVHPAFRLAAWGYFDPGETLRVKAFLGRGHFYKYGDVEKVTNAGGIRHGTRVAAIALGSVMDGQDSRVVSTVGREARSGLARRAAAFFAEGTVSEALDRIDDVGVTDISADLLDGLDVLSCSLNLNHSDEEAGPAGGRDTCATDDDGRGLDAESEAVVWAYLDKHVVTVKSAGNRYGHGPDCAGLGAARSEVGAPGASPAAIALGASASSTLTADRMQETQTLNASSSGHHTLDGRAYPSLVTPHWQCGCAAGEDVAHARYHNMGATSGAAPRAAGSLVLFKHWYLDAFGATHGNQPGRLVSQFLNFADGYAAGRNRGSTRVAAPSGGWGLGRLRLRLFENTTMSGDWHRGASGFTLSSGEAQEVDLGGGSPIPLDAQRLRITVWWLEVNTGQGEHKAEVMAWLADGSGEILAGSWRENDGECVLRWDYDCADREFSRPPVGEVHLTLVATSTPEEERYNRRTFRAFHVAWFWECGPDTTTIVCNDEAEPPRCPVVLPGDGEGVPAGAPRRPAPPPTAPSAAAGCACAPCAEGREVLLPEARERAHTRSERLLVAAGLSHGLGG